MNNKKFEVIIIGGGPAGMSTSLVLGRSRIKTLILSAEKPRNSITTHSHGFLTQDGKHPSEILATAKNQLKKYSSVIYKTEKAVELNANTIGFTVKTENNTYESKKIVIATGYKDNIEEIGIKGLTEVYGKSIYPCPFCDGFELVDKKLAIIGDTITALAFAKTISHWSKDLIVFTNGEKVSDTAMLANLKLNDVQIIDTKIKKLHSEKGILHSIELEDGELIERKGGFLSDTKSTEYTNFAKKLNIPKETNSMGEEMYKVKENKETYIKGLYIIGDARTGWSGVASSVAEGSEVGTEITHQVIEENWKIKT